MSEFVINVTQDAPTVIDMNSTHPTVQLDVVQNQPQSIIVEDDANNVLLNPAFFYNGINIVYLTGVSGELLHNTFGDLQGGTTGQYYHLSSGQYFNLATGSVVRPNETGNFITASQTGAFYPITNPSGFITGVDLSAYVTGSVVRPSETGNFITTSQTGAFYASSNPSGFITGVDLSFSGNYYTKSESESRYVNTTGAETISGIKTFSDNIIGSGTGNRLPSQTASSSDSIMTRSMTEEFLLWTPNIMQYFPIAGSTTNGGSVSVTAGQSVQIVAGTQSSGTARTTLVSDWMFSNAAGGSMRYDRPFKVRIPMNCNMNYTDTTGQASCRVYVGSNGSFTLPYAGQEPYPTGTRGVGVEWRKASGSFQQEFRLFARNGTNTTTGQFIATNYTGIGASNSSNSKFYDLLLTFNTDVPTNPILSLYASPWIGLNDTVPSRQSSTPVLTLSGAGVPTGAASLPTNWGRIEAAVVGDGGAIPLQSNTTLNYFRTIYLQQA